MSRNQTVVKSILQIEMKYQIAWAKQCSMNQLLAISNHLASLSQRTCITGLANAVLHNNVQTLLKQSQQTTNMRLSL